TPQDRMRAFREDLAALNELAVTVHQKAVDGDNAAGHLDLKIRERKAAMFGYDSPTRFDMVMVSELKRPSSSDVLEAAFDALVAQDEIPEDSKARIRAAGGYRGIQPEPIPNALSDPEPADTSPEPADTSD